MKMKKVMKDLLAAVVLVAIGQAICLHGLREGDDAPRARQGDRNLKRADLTAADLRGLDLRGAMLEEADLRESDLSYADLTGSSLRRAEMRNANFEGAIGLSTDQKDDARRQGAVNVPD